MFSLDLLIMFARLYTSYVYQGCASTILFAILF